MSTADSDRTSWTAAAEAELVSYLTSAAEDGKRSDNNFKPQVYTKGAEHLKKNGYSYTAKQVKSRWQRFKDEFKTLKTLKGLSGFGWDESCKMVTAEARVWDAYLPGHPKAKPFRKKGFPLYDEINALIGGTAATGELAISSENALEQPESQGTSSQVQSQSSPPIDPRLRCTELAGGDIYGNTDNEDELDKTPPPPSQMKARCSPSPSPFRTPAPPSKRQRVSGASAITSLADSIGTIIANGIPDTPHPQTQSPTRKDKAFAVACKEEGLSPTSIANARKVFRGNPELASEYLSFDTSLENMREARSIWLQDELERVQAEKSRY